MKSIRAAIMAVLSLAASAALANTVLVADGDVPGLIAAFNSVNQAGGTVVLAPNGTYTLTQPDNWWYGPTGLPAITANVLVIGNGAAIARGAMAPKFRFFYVGFTGQLALTNVTLQGGLAKGGNGGSGYVGGGGGAGLGGAIYNQGTLRLSHVALTSNTAQGGAGGNGPYNPSRDSGGGGGLGGDGGDGNGQLIGSGGGGGFKTNGANGEPFAAGSGGVFLNAEGGTCFGGVSTVGGNGGNPGFPGGGGGGYVAGQDGGVPSGFDGGSGALGGGSGGYSNATGNGTCGGGGGAFGGGGGGKSQGGGGGGGVGGGGGGGNAAAGLGGAGGFGGGGGGSGYSGQGVPGGFGGGAGGLLCLNCNNTPGGFGGGFGSGFNSFDGGGGGGFGGAVFNHRGTMSLGHVALASNATLGGTGGTNGGAGLGLGGGIFNLNGAVTLWDAAPGFGTGDAAPDLYNLSSNDGKTAAVQTPLATVVLIEASAASYAMANNQLNGTATIATGTAAEAVLGGLQIGTGFYANTHDFGNVAVGCPNCSTTFTLANAGPVALTISSATLIAPAGGFSTSNDCGSGLPAKPMGQSAPSCTFTVNFSPPGGGVFPAWIVIADNSPDSPQVVYLKGSATSLPGAPTNVSALSGSGQATVSFQPGSDGGLPVDSFTATCTPVAGGTVRTGTGTASPVIVSSLVFGTTYTCTVHAHNSLGNGPESAPSNPITPSAAPAGTINIVLTGTGTGTVTSVPAGINCPGMCSHQFSAGTGVVMTASPTGGSVFTGWLGVCTGVTCTITSGGTKQATAYFASPGTPVSLDIDANGKVDALTDGVIAMRYLFGVAEPALVNAALASNATRTVPGAVATYLGDIRPVLDIDGDGVVEPATDGLLLMRYLMGLRGEALIGGATSATATRTMAGDIEAYIESLIPI